MTAKSHQHDPGVAGIAPDAAPSQQGAGRANSAAQQQLAQAHFRHLLRLHIELDRIQQRSRSDASRYATLDKAGLGLHSEAMAKAARETRIASEIETRRITRAILDVSDGHGQVREDISPAYVAQVVSRFQKRVTELRIDAELDTAHQRPDSSLGGGVGFASRAAAVGGTAAAYGAATSIPLLGEALDAAVGKDVRSSLERAGTLTTDAEIGHMAVTRGEAIGKTAGTIAQLPLAGSTALKAMDTASATIGAGGALLTGKDVWTGRELTTGEIALTLLGAGAKSTGMLAGATQDAKMAQDMAALGGDLPATTIAQVASGLSTANTIAVGADQAAVVGTGHSLFAPETEKTGTERVFAGLGLAAKGTQGLAGHSSEAAWRTSIGETPSTLQTSLNAADTITQAVGKGLHQGRDE